MASDQGDCAAARVLYEESLGFFREIGNKDGVASALEGMASVCIGEVNTTRAVVLWVVAGVLRESIGASLPPFDQAKQDAVAEPVRAERGEAAFVAAWAEGGALTWEQAVELALALDEVVSTGSVARHAVALARDRFPELKTGLLCRTGDVPVRTIVAPTRDDRGYAKA